MTIINKYFALIFCATLTTNCIGQPGQDSIFSFSKDEDVTITIDQPANYHPFKTTVIIFFALPNGNTTAQTMGKTMKPDDDWHFGIQHIRAQTKFIRGLKHENIVVVYLENNQKSWSAWKAKHSDYAKRAVDIVDTVKNLFAGSRKEIYLNGHSGGGRFIFSYIEGVPFLSAEIKRISFIDSNYGYDSAYLPKLQLWLGYDRMCLNIFAYNDSIALYNDKPVVSATGGTWYRSHRMMQDLQTEYPLTKTRNDSLIVYKGKNARIQFFLKTNPDRRIYHTQQVERNGFIHSVLCGTIYDSKGYTYYGERAYGHLIEDSILLR